MITNLRGKNYELAIAEFTPQLITIANQIKDLTGKFSCRDIATLSKQSGLPAKTVCEFLEYAEFLPTGTWERLPQKTQSEIRRMAKRECSYL